MGASSAAVTELRSSNMEEYTRDGLRGLMPDWIKTGYRSLRSGLLSYGLNSNHDFHLSKEEQEASSRISVIIAVHDSPEVTERCLKSVRRFGGESEVIVVDDGSKLDATRQLVRQACSLNHWRLIRIEAPLGHSRASEAGIAVSTRPYICLLNSDTVLTPKSWWGMVRAFDVSPKIAVVGPSTSHTVTVQVVPRALYCRHYWSDEQIWCFAEKYVARHLKSPLINLGRVGGFAFFVRRSIWDEMGGFDKQLADYGNETEFCKRLKRHNFRVVWSKGSYIHHLGSESYGRLLGLAEIRKRGWEADMYIQDKLAK
jgi:O-antigen biosynthesis protein